MCAYVSATAQTLARQVRRILVTVAAVFGIVSAFSFSGTFIEAHHDGIPYIGDPSCPHGGGWATGTPRQYQQYPCGVGQDPPKCLNGTWLSAAIWSANKP